jgi:hypothetical protein
MKEAGNFPEHVYRVEPNDTLSIKYPSRARSSTARG